MRRQSGIGVGICADGACDFMSEKNAVASLQIERQPFTPQSGIKAADGATPYFIFVGWISVAHPPCPRWRMRYAYPPYRCRLISDC